MTANPIGNRTLIRAINRSTVLNCVKNQGPIPRTQIAELTGLSEATISGITAELIELGLIQEKEQGASSGGRRPILLSLNPRGGYVIGLKLSEDQVTGALTDLEASVILGESLPLRNKSIHAVNLSLVKLVNKLLAPGGINQAQLLGVGVGLAGIVDTKNGSLRYSPIFGDRNVGLAEMLQEEFNVEVFLDNDVNTLTLAEQHFGLGRGVRNFIVVTVGRGVGLGMVINGQIYRGAHGGSGEFGHTVVDPEGDRCDCGKRGCLETFVADPYLVKRATAINADVKTMPLVLEEARSGQANFTALFERAGEALARGVANLINVLSPELVIISGEGVRAGALLFEPMHAALESYIMRGLKKDTEILIDDWQDDAWARGAASLVLGELFESPLAKERA